VLAFPHRLIMNRSARIRRILLGFAAGASFGLLLGAIVATWILGRAAGGDDIDQATLISIGVAALLGVVGGYVADRNADGGRAPGRGEG